MLRSYKVCSLVLILILLLSTSYAQDKRGIGLFPFENLSNDKKYDWISFGFEYLLSNKLSNIAAYYVPEKNIIQKALVDAGYGKRKIDGEMVYHVGKSTGISIGISGTYNTNGSNLKVNVSFVNAFNGATIFSKEYNNNFNEIFFIANDIIKNIIDLTTVTLSSSEQNIVNRQLTKSVKAFEYFSNGYIENEKPSAQREIVIGLFRNAIREDPNFWEAAYNLGIAYFNDQNYNQALEQFDRIITALPDFEKPYYGRALILYRRNDYENAKKDFQQVIKYNPNDYNPYFYLGKISINLKQFADAQKYLLKAAEINPDYSKIYLELGNIYFTQHKYRNAIPHFKKAVELDPLDKEGLQKLGECYYRTQVYYSASSQFKKILESDPFDPAANFMLGITIYKEAVLSDLIEAFLELFDVNIAEERKQNKNLTGTGKERQEVYREMVSAFSRARKGREDFIEATFNLALTYHDMGTLDSAQTYYLETIKIDPNLVKAHVKLAKVYDELDEKDKALAEYKKIMSIDPSYFVVHPTLGPEHNYINIVDVTLNELDESLKDNPDDLASNQTMAKIYFAQGFFGKAANIYRKILKIRPNDSEAKEMLAKLENK